MKMEIRIGGNVLVIESESAFSVKLFENRNEPVDLVPKREETIAQAEFLQNPEDFAKNSPDANTTALYARLVELRTELAVSANVPPYVIFKDKALLEMVEKLPKDLAEFANISGVGNTKLEKYGSQFLAVINGAEVGF